MTWNRTQFEIADTEMGRMTVSGWASSAGIGLHVEDESIDELGRRRWNVTHLRSGIMFLRVKARTPEESAELGDLIVNQARYSEYATLRELMEADASWVARLIGIKHAIGGDWIEFPDPAMNEPDNVIMLPHELTERLAELQRRGLVSPLGEWLGEISRT